jgi:hypothetical protein
MRILKKTLLVIVAFVAMVLLIAAFLPSSYSIARSIEINAPAEVVYKQVGDFSTWISWEPWSMKDSKAKHIYSGIPGTQGHSRYFKGDEIGEGTLTIQTCTPPSLIISQMDVIEPAEIHMTEIWKFETTANGTHVEWTSSGDLSYPIGRLYGLMLNSVLGNKLHEGLDSLKVFSEAMIEVPLAKPEDLLINSEQAD